MLQRFQDLQVTQSREVQRQVIVSLVERETGEVGYVASQMLRQIMQNRAGGAGGSRPVFQSKSVQRGDFKMITHRKQSRLKAKRPIVVSAENPAEGRGWVVIGRFGLFPIRR